ncbi:hypothetical protein NQ317_016196 [Molorchus minor]|uniref:C2H2-type domain-containing protein n=1 Tax=Molorchus minor TaxID=1323400 RepID=A0ABQ9IZU5_9CUCU|nr:hypothetical protein NQ317_016196 [Molorchus minor]
MTMEIAVDSYLHKKFKKQLSIEPRPQHNDKENNNRRLEAGEEKTDDIGKQGECSKVADTHSDNKNSVPNQSTNPNTQSIVSNLSKSSISVGNCLANQQSTNHCISYIEAHNPNEEQASFDTSFNEPTNSSISTSSILNSIYYKHSYAPGKEDSVIYEQTDDPSDLKSEEIQPPPDRNASGKYVCTYCSLVCSKPSVLQKHIRAHTNERPYPCISCGFSFKTRSNLYKHCRSRTHANRVMGNKPQEPCRETDNQIQRPPPHSPQNYIETKEDQPPAVDIKLKPYKPRFHTNKQFFETVAKENIEEERQNSKNPTSDLISHHINEIINKNNSIVNSNESTFIKKCYNELVVDTARANNNDYNIQKSGRSESYSTEEPLNLSSKNRKRCMSEIAEPVVQKSLIKELLLKNLYSNDMQCPYCKMIFQTVTELDVHKYRNCKGKPSGIKYTRSSSVNVASILTHNKNAFDNIPQFQNTVFPLNSPGPF